eukprot:m.114735 g.114735  ORF g.114735 m.114735 type:complete len:1149 (-) comp14177_c1_seq5:2155-5601(-)
MADYKAKGGAKSSGVEDMTLLTKISDDSIAENLKRRYLDDLIYTYIGSVLISVNPYKAMSYFTEKELEQYQGAAIYENPPHVYALTDDAYRNMLIDSDNQCIIISGESGAGKTVSAKFIMNYITKVTGGGSDIQRVKNVILESNPLLEAFGNAKTVRNNNSSRFGKYCEIQFSFAGQPDGGRISNFLLEKSRVVSQNPQERNFHVFYQLCFGSSPQEKEALGIQGCEQFMYLNTTGCYTVDDTDDVKEWGDTKNAMSVMGLTAEQQSAVSRFVAAILHLGNIDFVEDGAYAKVRDTAYIDFPAYLLGIDPNALTEKLTTRLMESRWGGKVESTTMTLTVEQATHTRDALAKAIYSRLFDYLVQSINQAMVKQKDELSIGVLDIYGFEIFERNGFEQFCINFVNEKLQQIFIELTLKAEQEEYQAEGIQWKEIEFFNNKVVCDLIEEKRPPGIMCVLDDVCATLHAQSDGADSKLLEKLNQSVGSNDYYVGFSGGFTITHYAGQVTYEAQGFCERNRDHIIADLLKLVQSSSDQFLVTLFPDDPNPTDKHGRQKKQDTASGKIKKQANELVNRLMKATPHYIRCIKPNETKRTHDWDKQRCMHQVQYLGLKENVRVRRAGFAFRRVFDKFLRRYAILTDETYPKWNGDPRAGVNHLLNAVSMESDQFQLGRTKVFIKNPESLFLLEELRERKYDRYARKIQVAYRRWKSQQHFENLKKQAVVVMGGRKERRRGTINKDFMGDYMGYADNPGLRALVGKKTRIDFALTVKRYDRKYKEASRDLLLSPKGIFIIGREREKKGPNKGQVIESIKRMFQFNQIAKISISSKQDGFVVIHNEEYDTVLDIVFKTEFLTLLANRYKEAMGRDLPLDITDMIEFRLKKEGMFTGGKQVLEFRHGASWSQKTSGKKLVITVPEGLPGNTEPGLSARSRGLLKKAGGGPSRAAPSRGYGGGAPQQRYQPPPPQHHAPPPQHHAPPPQHHAPPPQQRYQPPPPQHHAPPPQQRYQPPPPSHNAPPPQQRYAPPPQQAPQQSYQAPPQTGGRGRGGVAGLAGVLAGRMGNQAPGGRGGGRGGPNRAAPPPPAARPKPMPKPKPKLPQGRALYDYEAQDVDELTLATGDIVTITKKDPSGWWQGKLKGKEGLFPGNYLEEL